MSFTKKRIDVTLSLGTGEFGDTGANTVTLTGLRVQASVVVPGGDAMAAAQVRIFGLPLDMINQLTAVGPINSTVRLQNSMLVAAGDNETGLKTIFSGTIDQAWGEFQGVPDVPLNVIGAGGLAALVKPVGALSFQGATDVATIMQGLAATMGLTFENNGVTVQLSNPYFSGTALMQCRACARAADINFAIDRGVLAIWPKTGARGGDIPLISVDTDMIGYPTFSSNGLGLTTLFNPDIKPGGYVQVQSTLKVACGKWYVPSVAHSLESETPGGNWFTEILGQPPYDQ